MRLFLWFSNTVMIGIISLLGPVSQRHEMSRSEVFMSQSGECLIRDPWRLLRRTSFDTLGNGSFGLSINWRSTAPTRPGNNCCSCSGRSGYFGTHLYWVLCPQCSKKRYRLMFEVMNFKYTLRQKVNFWSDENGLWSQCVSSIRSWFFWKSCLMTRHNAF